MATQTPWHSLFTATMASSASDIDALIRRQAISNAESVNLVASESYCPRATLEAEASILINKNASGYPPRIAFSGGEIIDEIEHIAIERAKGLFGAEHANVQPLSSTIANVAVLRALVKPGGKILAFDRHAGGHSSHGSARHVSGQDYEVEWFGVDEASEMIDYDDARRKAMASSPAIIIAGSSAYPRQIDFEKLRDIATETGALLFADIAHVSGLVVAGLHPNPTPYCDVVTTSTHKTFCGPRTGGLILSKAVHGKAIDDALAPGLQAAPGAHIIAARAVLYDLVTRPAFGDLMRNVIAGAGTLAQGLRNAGLKLYANGTDTHMVVVDLRKTDWQERDLNVVLEQHGLVANSTTLPRRAGDISTLGLRLGSTPMSIRGLGDDGFVQAASAVATLLAAGPRAGLDTGVASRMRELAMTNPIPYG